MKLDQFIYTLPPELIAQHPLSDRDHARLMVVDRSRKKIIHDKFLNLGQYLPSKSTIVLNNSKVIPARLFGYKKRSGGKVEIFLLKKTKEGRVFETLLKPLSKIRNGDEIVFNGGSLTATVVDVMKRHVRFNRMPSKSDLEEVGHMPLPPYIRRADLPQDKEDYQTVYARYGGSVAAPTAGLHFTKKLLAELKKQGHTFVQVTLHINHATFKMVETEDIREHPMHYETYAMSRENFTRIQKDQEHKRSIVAVGTTSCRVLESVAGTEQLKGDTNLFIYPGYEFKAVDILLTNFHFPKSTLLMLVYAFGGMDLMQKAYAEAIKEKYRFFSYGDAMLIV